MRENARLTQSGSNIGFYVSCDELRDFVSKELCGGAKHNRLLLHSCRLTACLKDSVVLRRN